MAASQKKPNIAQIKPIRVRFQENGKNRYGTAIGAIFRPYWHPYMYEAFHIKVDDGREVTVHAKQVSFLN